MGGDGMIRVLFPWLLMLGFVALMGFVGYVEGGW